MKVGVSLLTKKSETGELVWESIMNMKKVPSYKGDLYEFRSSCFSATTTPNQPLAEVQPTERMAGQDVCRDRETC